VNRKERRKQEALARKGALLVDADPEWLRVPGHPDLAGIAEQDADLIRSLFRVATLPTGHPVRSVWESPTLLARASQQHLADDLRECRAVPGFAGLLDRLRSDVNSFEAIRFELRVAASLARAPGQQVLSLGGSGKGPDVVAKTRTGGVIRLACYRASSATPDLHQARGLFERVAADVLNRFLRPSPQDGSSLAIALPAFPLRGGEERVVHDLVRTIWNDATRPSVEAEGVKVERREVPPARPLPLARRAMRLRFTVPLGKWEDARIERQLVDKLEYEEASWAQEAPVGRVFAVERSAFADPSKVRRLLDDASKQEGRAFDLYQISLQGYGPQLDGVPHSFEEVEHIGMPQWPAGLDLELRTFGDSVATWSNNDDVFTVRWDEEPEEYDLWQQDAVRARCTRRRALGSERRLERIDSTTFPRGREDPGYKAAVEAAMARILGDQ
jgi:hypothetical protein